MDQPVNFRKLQRLIPDGRVAGIAGKVLSRPTAPFREEAVVLAAGAFAAQRPWVVITKDADGNLHLSRRGARRTASPAVFSAHMDHPGFIATACRRAGQAFRVKTDFRGGVEDRYFPGAKVRFFPDEIPARVLSVRKTKGGDKTALLESSSPVEPGAFGMWDLPPFRRDGKKGLLWSRAVDDLAGAAAILALFDVLPEIDPRARMDVRGILTRGEEVGFWGAIGAARAKLFPKGSRMISLEASKALSHAPLGGGPILRTGDRASVFDDGLTRSLAATAHRLAQESRGAFRWQRKLMDGGTCEGTAYQAYGFRTGALCVPLLNYHNMGADGKIAAEAAALSDLAGMARWMAAWALEAPAEKPMKERLEGYYRRWRGVSR